MQLWRDFTTFLLQSKLAGDCHQCQNPDGINALLQLETGSMGAYILQYVTIYSPTLKGYIAFDERGSRIHDRVTLKQYRFDGM